MVKMTKAFPDHQKNIVALKRIEGQVRGIQKMIADRRYCVDILTQLHSILGAIARVEDNVLHTHMDHCFTDTLRGKSEAQKRKKISEVVELLNKFRKA